MNRKALINQLISIQSQTQAALDILLLDDDYEPECEHQNKQVYTTMGAPEYWVCKDCGYEYKEN